MKKSRRVDKERNAALGRIVLGAYLVLIGGLVLASNRGVEVRHGVWNYWPFLLIAGGAVKLIFGRGEALGEGFWILLAGLYCWVSVWNLWGLTWGTAWPIFLVAGGVSMALGPALDGKRKVCAPGEETAAADEEKES
jgi:hypothetical protein